MTLISTISVLAAEPLFVDSGDELTTISGNLSRAVALGDVDGDGDPDAVVAQGGFGSSDANVIWLNDGSGRFTVSPANLGSGESVDVALADLDGDGDLDIWIANQSFTGDTRDVIWLNQGGRQNGVTGRLRGSAWTDC